MSSETQEYVIPLKNAYYVPRWKRAKKAIKIIRKFVTRHLKVEDVKISNKVNEIVWKRNIKKPPRKIRVKVVKIDEETAEVKLPNEE